MGYKDREMGTRQRVLKCKLGITFKLKFESNDVYISILSEVQLDVFKF